MAQIASLSEVTIQDRNPGYGGAHHEAHVDVGLILLTQMAKSRSIRGGRIGHTE